MDNLRKKLKEKLRDLTSDQNKTIKKTFVFSIEELQDSPEECFEEIYQYLSTHKDRIEDFWFNSYLDENSFLPTLVINILPQKEIRHHMINNHWENLINLPIDNDIDIDKVDSIIESLEKVFQNFLYEFNTKEIRETIILAIKQILSNRITVDFEIVDFTDKSLADKGSVDIRVIYENKIFTFKDFLIHLSSKKLLN
jgi:hypothetical protein